MPRYLIDEQGRKHKFDRESGEWVLIEGNPVGESESPAAETPDEAQED